MEYTTLPANGAAAQRRPDSPVRLTLASQLGHAIDGAWWPRTAHMSRELAGLIAVLECPLGGVVNIDVNWSSLQAQPKLDSYGWEGKHQHVMTVSGRDACASLLVVPHRTNTALAVMVLRRAARLPIDSAHRDTQALRTADCILRAAWSQRAKAAPVSIQGRRDASRSADVNGLETV